MLEVDALAGLWRRGFIAWPDGRYDSTTHVTWLQAATSYVDLRQLCWPPGQFSATCLNDLSMAECETLATQQGFAGVLEPRGKAFEWVRLIDFQPRQPTRDIGNLSWQDDVLVEQGVETDYLEHWHRDEVAPQTPCGALHLRGREDNRWACLLRAGDRFMFARDRSLPVSGTSLTEAIAGAATLQAAQKLIDFEVSFGNISDDRWLITRSSLPFRAGENFRATPRGNAGIEITDADAAGEPMLRSLEITTEQGDASIFFNGVAR